MITDLKKAELYFYLNNTFTPPTTKDLGYSAPLIGPQVTKKQNKN